MSKFLYKNISYFLFNISLISLILRLFFIFNQSSIFIEWSLTNVINSFTWTFALDFTALLFLSTVLFISRNVVWYSQSYLRRDKDANRFILLVLGFVISMCLLITSPNIVTILLGWDGLGLISYCLVIYYPTKKSRSAGILTVIRNRVGDICLLLLIGWYRIIGDYNFFVWGSTTTAMNRIEWISFLVIFGAITKRAQIPFSAWLPAAIAAPTPVSALVHSSTLVTAGVYLLIRFSEFSRSSINFILLNISSLTMFISGLVAFFEYDLKKIIALSTLSQLGVIMFAISINLPELAFFHLITHALFKALLFLCAGVIIHGNQNSQDIRSYGSLILNFPVIGSCLNLANLSLCGLPFLSGFYSKDIIVELAAQNTWNQFIILIMFSALGLTVAYSVRLVYFTFISSINGRPVLSLCDTDRTLFSPIVNLTFMALFSGASLSWVIFPFPSLIMLPEPLKLLTTFIIIFSCILALRLTSPSLHFNLNGWLSSFNLMIWNLPILSGQRTRKTSLPSGLAILKSYDRGWLEFVSKNQIEKTTSKFSQVAEFIQKNSLKTHFLVFLTWILLFSILWYFHSLKLKA